MKRLLTALLVSAWAVSPAASDDMNTVVVELFTSQGCSSCPPADEMMHELVQRDDVIASAAALLDTTVPNGSITEAGVRQNVDVGIQYLAAWLGGNGAAAIYNLMEDAATAEISRSQIWQWVHLGASTDSGVKIDRDLIDRIAEEELDRIRGEIGDGAFAAGHFEAARDLFEEVALSKDFPDFLTLPAYDLLVGSGASATDESAQ